MTKPIVTVPELLVLLLGSALAAGLGWQLASHHISALAIIAVVSSLLANASVLGARVTQARRVKVFTCPSEGCSVRIEALGVDEPELTRLRDRAINHSQHNL